MNYTQIAIASFILSIIFDMRVTKIHLFTRKVFWTSYAIILPFQLLTNWWLTSRNIVMYKEEAIIGIRIASAPLEDLFFGFSLLLGVLTLWVYIGKKNQRA
jgi:lycopene cyclase domain-containing protein